ncbi:hypothetical protein UA08_07062 [Talaromyces atroroseus]|uniref:Transcription factor domain-containing protein n=1 Tax=Talaromyces atroroseus TaxID=1441469 RepID=A0A225ARV8_TALAT|nr:hypothetical protein UA08_07062 [Talaromyces atroroseus]OKL57696.1 hypothetical protein UA08_07062 [Talaromyces atroroseus]
MAICSLMYERAPSSPTFAPCSEQFQPRGIEINTSALGSTGFFGSTSYRAPMQDENHSYIFVNTPRSIDDEGVATLHSTTTVEPRQLQLGVQVANFVAAHAVLIRKLVDRMYTLGRLVIIPRIIMRQTLDHLWDLFKENPSEEDTSYSRAATRMFNNSYRPISITQSTTLEEFCLRITGPNTRWETIGNVLVMACLSLCHISESEIIFLDPNSNCQKSTMLSQFQEMAEQVLAICNGIPLCNELVVCLKYNQMFLASQKWGNSSHWLYSAIGELTSSLFATGIHQDTGCEDKRPKYLNKWRLRCFAMVYIMDKLFATFLGRPPFLTRHYCKLDPLFKVNSVMTVHNFTQGFDMLHLEESGENQLEIPGYLHFRFLLSTVREEILELHLGTGSHNVPEKTKQIISTLQSMWDSCPAQLRYSPKMWTELVPYQNVWVLFALYLEQRYSLFLVHRLRAQKSPSNPRANLLSVAKDILSTILVINRERERLRAIRSDLSSVLLPFGLPTAEVLLEDLLHQSASSSVPSFARPSRGDTIRDLIVFVSCLEWAAEPGSNHFELGQTIKSRFTRLLDHIIDPPRSALHASNAFDGVDQALEVSGYPGPGLDTNPFVDWDFGSNQDIRYNLWSGSFF